MMGTRRKNNKLRASVEDTYRQKPIKYKWKEKKDIDFCFERPTNTLQELYVMQTWRTVYGVFK